MLLYIGEDMAIPEEEILGIFDLDNTSTSHRTRTFLRKMEEQGRVESPKGNDIPRSFLLCSRQGELCIALSCSTTATLRKRHEESRLT
jgi:hypothetical protein